MANLPPPTSPFSAVDFDAFLRQIAESAQALSNATGAAIAIRDGNDRNGEQARCVARSGDTAPPLGSPLDPDSGISGECLRTGKILHCTDTSLDPRVDSLLCRDLGFRSIVVVPLQGPSGTAGVLEVFSGEPGAFTGEHVESLKRLTEMVEMAYASESAGGPAAATREEPGLAAGAEPAAPAAEPLPSRIWADIRFPFPLSFLKDRRDYWIAGSGLAVLLFVTLIGLKAFPAPKSSNPPRPLAQPSTPTPQPEMADLQFQKAAATTRAPRHPVSGGESQRLQAVSKLERLTGSGDAAGNDSRALKSEPNVEHKREPAGPDVDTRQLPPLTLVSSAPPPDGVLVAPATLPGPSPSISQGITGGQLEHRVNPVYPPEALAMKLEGEVVLAATITKTGQVRDLKLLKGIPILGRAAIAAVKQWHYQPYRLNDQPLESQTEITVRFHAPR
jgi:TonB family protein